MSVDYREKGEGVTSEKESPLLQPKNSPPPLDFDGLYQWARIRLDDFKIGDEFTTLGFFNNCNPLISQRMRLGILHYFAGLSLIISLDNGYGRYWKVKQ